MKKLKYKGFYATVKYESDSDVFVGRLENITDIISFEAVKEENIKQAFIVAVDDYIAHCQSSNKTVPYDNS